MGDVTTAIEFVVPGAPVPKERPRVVRSKQGGSFAFTPKRTLDYERLVKFHAMAAMRGVTWPLNEQYRLCVALYEDSALVRLELIETPRKRAVRFDVDNAKCFGDAMNGVCYDDDRQILELGIVDMGRET